MRDLLSERKLAGGDRIAINSQPILGNFKIPLLIASQLYLAGVLFLCTSTRAGVYIKDSIEVIIVQSDSGLRSTCMMMNTRGGMCGGLAYVMVILLFLVASPVVQCKFTSGFYLSLNWA